MLCEEICSYLRTHAYWIDKSSSVEHAHLQLALGLSARPHPSERNEHIQSVQYMKSIGPGWAASSRTVLIAKKQEEIAASASYYKTSSYATAKYHPSLPHIYIYIYIKAFLPWAH